MYGDVEKILHDNTYATISTVDTEGRPWAAPVWYVRDKDMNLYWCSPLSSQHSKNIESNADVYITIFNSVANEGDGVGLYFRALASEIEESEIDTVMSLYNESTQTFKLNKSNCSGLAPTRLYKATPSELWINRGKQNGNYYEDFREKL